MTSLINPKMCKCVIGLEVEMYNGSKGPPVETSPMNPEMYNGSKGPQVKKGPMNQEMYNCERTELACFRPKRPSLNPTLDKNQSI